MIPLPLGSGPVSCPLWLTAAQRINITSTTPLSTLRPPIALLSSSSDSISLLSLHPRILPASRDQLLHFGPFDSKDTAALIPPNPTLNPQTHQVGLTLSPLSRIAPSPVITHHGVSAAGCGDPSRKCRCDVMEPGSEGRRHCRYALMVTRRRQRHLHD